jgi:succinate dehydrogenase / fumarate reductase cytochrome b subunit
MNFLFQKIMIALTGLFLCIFLVVHLSANFILLWPEEISQPLYNSYSTFLRENPLIKLVAYILYFSIILHIVYALIVTIKNRRAKPEKYVLNKSNENSSWASQNMGLLGIMVLLFIVIHLANFWAKIKLGIGEPVGADIAGNVNVYQVADALFKQPFYVLFYSVLAIPLGFHLNHGLKSALKTLGLHHKKSIKVLSKISFIYALVIALGFGVIPIIVYFK